MLLVGQTVSDTEIVSIADWPCSKWLERRQSHVRADTPQMWLSGFMTGLASATRVDVLAITDAPTVFSWMDRYCSAHVDASVSTGGLALFDELKRRLPTTPPALTRRSDDGHPTAE